MNRYRIYLLAVVLLALFSVSGEVVRYDRADGLSSPVVGGGVQGDNGLMWFATWNGLHCFDGYDFYRVSIAPGDTASINTNLIRTIAKTPDGTILCRTDDGIYEFDLSTMSFRDVADAVADTLSQSLRRVWHGTVIRHGDTDILWTGSTEGIGKEFEPHHPARLLEGTEVLRPRAVMADRAGRLWVGARACPQLAVYDRGERIDSMQLDFTPYAIYETSSGEIFAGGKPGGLVRVTDGLKISDDVVYDMAEDAAGRLWLATWGEGLKYIADPSGENPAVTPLGEGRKVRKLLVTRGGNLVAATSDGLITLRLDNLAASTVRRIPGDVSSLSSNATAGLAQDTDGNIYVATESSGISRVSEESLFGDKPVFSHYNVANSSLDRDEIYGMAIENDTTLIITGPDRVTILNPAGGISTGYSMPFWADDVTFAEGSPARHPDGTWAWATSRGVLAASAHSLYSRGYIPPVVVTAVSVNGGADRLTFLPDGHLDLDSRSRNITLRFAAIDYVDNSHILYRYRVDGSPWSAYRRARTLTLFNLTSGDHTVELQSTDRYGRRIDNTLTITLTVAPHWYETWWAMMLFLVAGAAAIGAGVWLAVYIRRVNRQRRELLAKYMALLEAPVSAETPAPEETPVVESVEDASFLKRVQAYIEENIANPEANIDAMAEASAVSRATLNRRLRSLMGVSAARLLLEARMNRATALLADGSRSTAEVAEACGYSDPYYFTRVYRKHTGK
ncbi:MAG: helix-turn-helix domain-containing protein [Duncaniella sp.]|nr:helix-turn-helix domain-containing protein [Duncaniella sp.]